MDHQVYFDGREFIPLAHPAEEYELKKLGVKEQDALVQGRIYWRDYFVCLDCRSIAIKRKVRLPDYLGLSQSRREKLIMGGVVVVGAVMLIFFNWPVYVGVIALVPVMIVLELIVTTIAKRKARRSAERLERDLRAEGGLRENGRCDRCGGRRLIDYLRFVHEHRQENRGRSEAMRCPKCDQMELYHDEKYVVIA